MDLRSTKSGLTKSIRRFRGTADVRTIGSFRGAIEPKFSDWIRGHWGFLEARLFRAVPLSFHRPPNPFGQICWPQPNVPRSHFVLAPNIQLTLRLTPITNVFFESNTSNFQSWPQSVAALGAVSRDFLGLSFTSNISNADRPRGTGGQPGAGTLRTSERLFGQLAGILQTWSVSGPSERTERPLLNTISSALRSWTQSLTSNLFHLSLGRSQAEEARDLRGSANGKTFRDSAGTMFSLPLLKNSLEVLARNGRMLELTRIDDATSSRQLFLTQLNNSGFWRRLALPERTFTKVVQKFAVSKSSGPETTARQIQYFGPSPDLSYARSDSPQLQQVVSALRDVRPAQSEIKQSAPQLPSIAQLTSQVRQELERELRIERERRGL